MRAGLARDAHAPLAALRDLLDALANRDVLQVDARILLLGQTNVARNHQGLRDARPATKAELRRDGALVHVAALGQRRLLLVQRDRQIERPCVLQGAAHQPGACDRRAVVGKARRAACREVAHLRERLARAVHADRGEEARLDDSHLAGTIERGLERGARVDRRCRVRHRQDRRVAARRAGGRAGGAVLLVLLARHAQMHVRIHEARQDGAARAVDDARTLGALHAVADLRDHAIDDQQLGRHVEALDGVEQTRAGDHNGGLVGRDHLEPGHAAPHSPVRSRKSITVPMLGRFIRS